MSAGEAAIALDELAFRVIESAEPNAWVVAVADLPSVSSSLRAEIERLRSPEDTPPLVVTIDSVRALFEAVHAHPRGTMIVIGAAAFSMDDWRSLDEAGLRSHLHPGNDDLQLPSPVLEPLEALLLMLYGCRPRREVARS